MKRIGSLEPSVMLADVSIGMVHFKKPGLKIIRFETKQKQEVKLDRLRLLKDASATQTDAILPKIKNLEID